MSLTVPRYATPTSVENAWITPQQQLNCLTSDLSQTIEALQFIPFAVANIIALYASDPNLVSWYTSLECLKALPKGKIPRLPGNIDQILNAKCPFFGHRVKPDGSYYKVTDTHVLTLIPEELGTLNLFEKCIKSYGQEHKLTDVEALQFRYFWEPARLEYGNARFERTHWELITTMVLAGSQFLTPAVQKARIASLAKKVYVVYQPLSLKNTIVALFLHKLAMGISLYPKGKKEDGSDAAFTLVQESLQGRCLIVGSFAVNGLHVSFMDDDLFGIGGGVRRQFF